MKSLTIPTAVIANGVILAAITVLGLMSQFGMWLFSVKWMAGSAASLMFMQKTAPTWSDPIRPCFEAFRGLLYNWHFGEMTQFVAIESMSWIVTIFVASIVGVTLTILQRLLCNALYGTPTKIFPKYNLWSVTCNTLFVMSFLVVGYAGFMASPSVSFFGIFGSLPPVIYWYFPLVALPGLIYVQHSLNLHACGK